MEFVRVEGRSIGYSLRYTKRKRTIGIRVTGAATVEVLSPKGVGRDEIERLIARKGAWILRHGEALGRPQDRTSRDSILLLGEEIPVRVDGRKSARSVRLGRDGESGNCLFVPPATADRRAALARFLKRRAKKVIGERVRSYSELMGVRPSKVLIKSNRASWGTCTPKNTLNFSFRLVMAPPDVVDYVVVHELAHLVHRGHSKAFWSTVSRYVDDVKGKRKWLRENGARLNV